MCYSLCLPIYLVVFIVIIMPPREPTFADTFTDAYKAIPIVTRVLLTAMLLGTVLPNFGLVDPYLMLFDWRSIWHNFHVSRACYHHARHGSRCGAL